ncbi:MAG: GMC family oxidoreductase [Acidobacteriaceae bacterium]|nr:GMC family oxidoreductase [Acidobacteriaceae bacterium]
MLLDLEQAPADVATESDVCIIGAGIAGLLLASRLVERGLRVHLLEAGGAELEDRSQQLYDAEMAATRHAGTTEGRFRTFGGSSTRWGGQLLPYTSDIYTPPPGVPSLGWPIDERNLAPYYAELQQILGVDALPFEDSLLPALGKAPLQRHTDFTVRFSKWIPFPRRNLGKTLGERLSAHPKITIYTHANVVALEGEAGSITAARARTYNGRDVLFRARTFLLTSGTLESPRLLLASPGVPNHHDQIGRYFHDHVSFAAAEFTGQQRAALLERFGPWLVEGTLHTVKIEASPELRSREHLLAVMGHLTVEEPEDSGAAAVRNTLRLLQRGKLGEAIGAKNVGALARGVPDVLRLATSARLQKRRYISPRARVRLNIDLEQAPSAENRIRLSHETDAIGMPRAIVDWRVQQAERDTAVRFAPHLAQWLEDLHMQPSQWSEALRLGQPELIDTFHPMGGTRMGEDPASSVVGPELRVHGLTNLYVASCSVFPAGGSSNPTFTMMALALRLADLLTARL